MTHLSLPQSFLDRLSTIFSSGTYPQIVETLSSKRPIVFRINTIKATVEDVLTVLDKERITYKPVSWYKDAFMTETIDAKELTTLPLYRDGHIYIQNLSSMIPPLVMNPTSTDTILDLAAAPGSKTSQIATLMHNEGEIIANDKSHDRLYKLRAVLTQQGVENVKIEQRPGEIIWKWHPEYFDKVLVDVPCSMEGRITTLDVLSYKDWSIKKIKMLSSIQKKLLRSAVSSTKVGGEIIYSTCTFAPEENEAVIDWLLEKEQGAVALEQISIDGLKLLDGLTQWGGKSFKSGLTLTKRVIPTPTMEGFFIAKIRKIKSTVPSLL